MLAERPLVAARGGGVVEIVEHNRTGLLFEPGNVANLRDALAALISDPARAESLGQSARRHAESRFGLEAMLNGVEVQVRELMAA
jgi:glycosyltransferase involved in cell wall biosynthesis